MVTQYYWPESFRINEVVDSLRLVGCEVTILTGQPNYPGGQVFSGYRANNFGLQQHDAGYDIFRVPIVPRGNSGAASLFFNYLSFVLSGSTIGLWLLRKRQFDVIFVYGVSPILQALPAIVLKLIKRSKLVTWVQDLWPQSLEVTGYVHNQTLLSVVAIMVRWIYCRCDLLLVQSRAFLDSVQAMSGKTPVHYYPNPGGLVFDETQYSFTPPFVLKSGFNIVFAGNLGKAQALETILEAAELLKLYDDIHFVLVGSGSCSEWVGQELNRRQLINVDLVGRFSPELMPSIFSQASVLLVSLARSPIMSLTVPSKVQSYLAAGKPIIASLDGEGARVVEESGAGLVCQAEDSFALAQAVLKLRAMSPKELKHIGDKGLNYYKEHFDAIELAMRLKNIFQDLCQGTNPLR